jgi:hypothetical protein
MGLKGPMMSAEGTVWPEGKSKRDGRMARGRVRGRWNELPGRDRVGVNTVSKDGRGAGVGGGG